MEYQSKSVLLVDGQSEGMFLCLQLFTTESSQVYQLSLRRKGYQDKYIDGPQPMRGKGSHTHASHHLSRLGNWLAACAGFHNDVSMMRSSMTVARLIISFAAETQARPSPDAVCLQIMCLPCEH